MRRCVNDEKQNLIPLPQSPPPPSRLIRTTAIENRNGNEMIDIEGDDRSYDLVLTDSDEEEFEEGREENGWILSDDEWEMPLDEVCPLFFPFLFSFQLLSLSLCLILSFFLSHRIHFSLSCSFVCSQMLFFNIP